MLKNLYFIQLFSDFKRIRELAVSMAAFWSYFCLCSTGFPSCYGVGFDSGASTTLIGYYFCTITDSLVQGHSYLGEVAPQILQDPEKVSGGNSLS
jgi:hypothetical protein|tara:strand:+ start:1138 stop:1422 length:285 start_codon:yes stop_codon:yes gene_type:complete